MHLPVTHVAARTGESGVAQILAEGLRGVLPAGARALLEDRSVTVVADVEPVRIVEELPEDAGPHRHAVPAPAPVGELLGVAGSALLGDQGGLERSPALDEVDAGGRNAPEVLAEEVGELPAMGGPGETSCTWRRGARDSRWSTPPRTP